MSRLLSISRFWGPLGTVVFTLIYHYGVMQGWYEISLGLIFLFVIAGAFVSGLWGGLGAAAWGTAYALYVMLPSTRLYQTMIGMILAAVLVGYGTRRLRQVILAEIEARQQIEQNRIKQEMLDSADSILRVFGEVLDITNSLRLGWGVIPDASRFGMLERAHGKLANLITLSKGFEQMAKNERLAKGLDTHDSGT